MRGPPRLSIGAGTEVAALFYSVIESAKLAGIEPDRYLRTAAHRVAGHRAGFLTKLKRRLATGGG